MSHTLRLPIFTAPIYSADLQALLRERLSPYPAATGNTYAVGGELHADADAHEIPEDMFLWTTPTPTIGRYTTTPRLTGTDIYRASVAQQDRFCAPLFQTFGHFPFLNAVKNTVSQACAGKPRPEQYTYSILCLREGVLLLPGEKGDEMPAHLKAQGHTHLTEEGLRTQIFAISPTGASRHAQLEFARSCEALLRDWMTGCAQFLNGRHAAFFQGAHIAPHF